MPLFSREIELNEEQFNELEARVIQGFKEGIGSQILKMHPEAFSKTIGEAIAKEAEKWAPRYCKETQEKMEFEITRWKMDQTFLKRMAAMETELKEIKQAHQDFQARIQVELDKMLLKLDQIMDGQRPQPNGALQELRAQIGGLDERLTEIEILARKRKS